MTERYFMSCTGFSNEGRTPVWGNMVVNSPHKLETIEHMGDLADQLSEKLGHPIVIISVFHMCTVAEEKE